MSPTVFIRSLGKNQNIAHPVIMSHYIKLNKKLVTFWIQFCFISCLTKIYIQQGNFLNVLSFAYKFDWLIVKLDWVGPVDNRPSTNKHHYFVQKKKKKKKKKWHLTRDILPVDRDKLQMTRFWGWTFSQNFSSLALTVCYLWYYEDLEEKDEWMNEWMNEWINDKAVHRTAPATPGLLIIYANSKNNNCFFSCSEL
jgi:hypothetical protein